MEPTEATKLTSINYIGPSMNPTLQPGDRLRVIPYNDKKIRRGDVITFVPPGGDSKIIHRVVSVDLHGIRTRGDNCNEMDQWVLNRDQILGRVVNVQRGKRRLSVFGGPMGQLFAVTIRALHVIDSTASSLLRPGYDRLARVGIFKRWLPAQMNPRVISYDRPAGTELQLLMGRHVVGRWLPGKSGWNIRRPFRLFVDEESLPENPGKGSVVRGQVENKAEVSGVPPTLY